MNHPDEGMLLAFTRQQPDGWPGGVEQHITQCLTCHARYCEYQRINILLLDATPIEHAYPSITDSVMQKLHELEYSSSYLTRVSKVVRKEYRGAIRPGWQLLGSSLAAVVVILCTLVVFALATAYMHIPAGISGRFTEFKPAAAAGKHKRPSRSTHAAVAPAIQNVTADGISVGVPTIAVCSWPTDVKQNHLRICGYNFKPGNRVALIIKMQGSRPKALKPVLVQSDGTIQDWFLIHSCDTLPSAIVAQYENSSTGLATLANIQFAGCNGEPYATSQTLHARMEK